MVTNSYGLGAVGPLPTPMPGELAAAPATVDANGIPVKAQTIPMAPTPQPLWLTGPGGPTLTRPQAAWLKQQSENGWFGADASGLLEPDPAFRFQTQARATAEPAWLASRGEGSSQLRGFLNNTDLFDIVNESFQQ